MVCRGINSICPIHGFLLSCSVQATGGESCWAVLPSLISKGYKLHYPAQSEPARTAPSIHPLFLCLPPLLFTKCCFLWRPPSLFPSSIPLPIFVLSWWLMGVVLWALSISFHRNTYIGKTSANTPKHGQSVQHTHINSHSQQDPGQAEATEGAAQV